VCDRRLSGVTCFSAGLSSFFPPAIDVRAGFSGGFISFALAGAVF
jgi:hypothetical protein